MINTIKNNKLQGWDIVFAVDPGLKGAICAMTPNFTRFYNFKSFDDYNKKAIEEFIRSVKNEIYDGDEPLNNAIFLVIEDQFFKLNAQSAKKLSIMTGVIIGVFGLPHENVFLINNLTWKKEYKYNDSFNTKLKPYHAIQKRRFPDINEGEAAALSIAEYVTNYNSSRKNWLL